VLIRTWQGKFDEAVKALRQIKGVQRVFPVLGRYDVVADIEVKGLTKYFNGFPAVNHVDLTVYKGELFGLLGPNGAGKTTLLNVMNGVTEDE
jgi:ABC-type polysaccharide/polyol phosphate transport system ATPase subunit